MRHLWKGFVLGGLTGAGIGAARDWDLRRRGVSRHPASEGTDESILNRLTSDNVWKGFLLGALAGSGVGILADLADRTAEAAVQAGQAVREHGPELAQRVAESDTVKSIGEAASQTAHRAAETADKARAGVSDLADDAVKTAKAKLDV